MGDQLLFEVAPSFGRAGGSRTGAKGSQSTKVPPEGVMDDDYHGHAGIDLGAVLPGVQCGFLSARAGNKAKTPNDLNMTAQRGDARKNDQSRGDEDASCSPQDGGLLAQIFRNQLS
jgi:hypothetical protein